MRDESALRGLLDRAIAAGRAAGTSAGNSAGNSARDSAGPGRRPAALAIATRIAVPLWLVVSAVNFVVWVLVCISTASWDSPWWLWGFGCGGVVVTALLIAGHSYRDGATRAPDRDGW